MASKDAVIGAAAPEPSDQVKNLARQWFKKAADCRERREYDYAIECFITGLTSWPEAVEEGHMPLRSLAIQRTQTGGKKPSMFDTMKKSTSGKDFKAAMLNAEHHLSKDPFNHGFAEALLKNAAKGGFLHTAKWIAPIVMETLRRDAKPNKGRFKSFRQLLADAAAVGEAGNDSPMIVFFIEQAAQSIEYQIARSPGDDDLRQEQRDLSGKLTIWKGKYQESDNFRESLQDAQSQKLIHDSERMQQGEHTYAALVNAAKKEYEQNRTVPQKVQNYVDVLMKRESMENEQAALDVLSNAHSESKNYSFKVKADDLRLKRLTRIARERADAARAGGTDEDKQAAREATAALRNEVVSVYRERVANYPTDLRMKFRLGVALFEVGEYDEAIPTLQAAQNEPRSKWQCQLYIGRSFYQKQIFGQAVQVLKELVDQYELQDDFAKDALYWLGRACEANNMAEDAKANYGKLLRLDYNYAHGDARKRLEALQS
jgi:TolA-binding protein